MNDTCFINYAAYVVCSTALGNTSVKKLRISPSTTHTLLVDEGEYLPMQLIHSPPFVVFPSFQHPSFLPLTEFVQ
jgi:hypothetical protein